MKRSENSVKNYYAKQVKKTLPESETEKINDDRFDFMASEDMSYVDPKTVFYLNIEKQ
jgi:hypothetical protein